MPVLLLVVLVVTILAMTTIIRTITAKPVFPEESPALDLNLDKHRIARNLSGAIQCNTAIYDDSRKVQWNEFKKLHSYLEKTYPLIHQNLEKRKISQYSLLYHWKSDHPQENPILLMAHLDVVPADGESTREWTKPPYSGAISDGFIWGRGAIDIKNQVIAHMEALEFILQQGWKINRDIYLAFGHDEEIRGTQGAEKIAALFKNQNLTFDLILDEGGIVSNSVLRGVNSPFAMVGIAEKGFVNLKISCTIAEHDSVKALNRTALERVCTTAAKIEKRQSRLKMTKPVKIMLSAMAPYLPGIKRLLASNLWLFGPLSKHIFARSREGNAMLGTTVSVTSVEGSSDPETLPQKADCTMNFRLLPGDKADKLFTRAAGLIKDKNIKITPMAADDPSRISDINHHTFTLFKKSVAQVFPGIPVIPYLVTGGTDARKYDTLCPCVLRFSPFKLSKDELGRMHGTDERIHMDCLEQGVNFLIHLLYNFCSSDMET